MLATVFSTMRRNSGRGRVRQREHFERVMDGINLETDCRMHCNHLLHLSNLDFRQSSGNVEFKNSGCYVVVDIHWENSFLIVSMAARPLVFTVPNGMLNAHGAFPRTYPRK